MRAIDRDLIRGGHYGQRPCVPHLKAEHMAAPTKTAAYVKKVLANSEPSTYGTSLYCSHGGRYRTNSGQRAALAPFGHDANDPMQQRVSAVVWLSTSEPY